MTSPRSTKKPPAEASPKSANSPHKSYKPYKTYKTYKTYSRTKTLVKKRKNIFTNVLTMNKHLTSALAIALIACSSAQARNSRQAHVDSLKSSHKVIIIDGDRSSRPSEDSIARMMKVFYEDQFRLATEPAAPQFMFMTRNTNFAMGIGGAVKLRAWYDWHGALPGVSFTPYQIPMHPDQTDMRALGVTPSGTQLYLKAAGRSERLGTYTLYIEGEFSGYNDVGFKLNKAYATLNDWTVGLASTTFSDPAALPPTVDAAGPNNKIDAAAVLVRYMHTWKDHWSIAASIENPAKLKIAGEENQSKLVRQWVPDFGVFAQYQWGQDGLQHIRLSATTREMSYRNLIEGKNHHTVAWGLQLSTIFNPIRPLTVFATVNGGRGIASLGGDLMLNNYDMVSDPDEPGTLYAPYVLGYMVGLQYYFTPKISASTAWGQARYYPRKHAVGQDEYRYGVYGSANIFYNITPRVQVGVGYNVGKRQDFSRDSRTAHRLGLLAAFAF